MYEGLSRERREGGGSEQTDIDSDGRRAHYRLATANANAACPLLMQRGALTQDADRLRDPAYERSASKRHCTDDPT